MPPTLATVVATHGPTDSALSRLNVVERQYINHLKKRERSALLRTLTDDAPNFKRTAATPLRIQVLQSKLPNRMTIFEDLQMGASPKYIQWVRKALQLPLQCHHTPSYSKGVNTNDGVNIARGHMDASTTGNDHMKHEVLKLVCQQMAGGTCASAYSIGLEGPPGTGKTHFVKTGMAPALDRPIVEIKLGGATDASFLLGTVYTYEGSKEGRLAAALMEARCCNPILYFDEVDKVSETDRGHEIISILIHLIDPTANTEIRDRYFHDIDLDFSMCTFVFSFNDASRVSPVLLDRMKVLRIPMPCMSERRDIIQRHLIPRVQTRLKTPLVLSVSAVESIVQRSTDDNSGMRGAEKDIDHVLSTAQLSVMCGTSLTAEVLNDEGELTTEFVMRCIGTREVVDGQPPSMMYT